MIPVLCQYSHKIFNKKPKQIYMGKMVDNLDELPLYSSPCFTNSHKLRFRSPRHVADEIEHVIEKYNIRQFRFNDDMFTANKKNILVLEVLNKKTTAADNVRALEMSAEIGYKTRILFMIRTLGQTKETVKINIDYLEHVPYRSLQPQPNEDSHRAHRGHRESLLTPSMSFFSPKFISNARLSPEALR